MCPPQARVPASDSGCSLGLAHAARGIPGQTEALVGAELNGGGEAGAGERRHCMNARDPDCMT